MTASGIRLTGHARDSMRRRVIDLSELTDALGHRLVAEGRLTAPRASYGNRPSVGAPLHVGRQFASRGRDARDVLLGISSRGRYLVIVIVVHPAAASVVTAWDPDDDSNLWRPDRLAPTGLGQRTLPPTHWYVEADPGRFQHRNEAA
jgi:hypothetical protein